MNNTLIHKSKNPEELAETFALQLINWVSESKSDTYHLALSGGKTPSLLFSLLAGKYVTAVCWEKIHFWWGDERMVEPNNLESNFGAVNKFLFSKINLNQNQIHRIKGEADPTKEAKRYGLQINSWIPINNDWPEFDLIMLGLGDDGHTASIFPDQMLLLESAEVTGIATHPLTGQQRITLTGKVLNNAKKVAFMISGESKAGIFNEIIQDSGNALKYPATFIRPLFGELHWFGDEASLNGKNVK